MRAARLMSGRDEGPLAGKCTAARALSGSLRHRGECMLKRSGMRNGKTRITFSLPADQPPGSVSVVGDFNDWQPGRHELADRKSTRLNSSHVRISYAVFCLKKKNPHTKMSHIQNKGLRNFKFDSIQTKH